MPLKRIVTLALAVGVLAVAMGMAGVSAWQRAGSPLDRALLVAMTCAIVAAVHLLPALVRGWWAWALWGLCFAAAVFGHAGFLTFSGQGAAESRHAASAQVQALQAREAAIREALASINARPVSVVAAHLSRAKTPERAQALEAELTEARRAAVLRDELVTVAATLAQAAATEGVTDPVTQGVARFFGLSVQGGTLVVNMTMAALVELLGAVLWGAALRSAPARKPDDVTRESHVTNAPVPVMSAVDPLASHGGGLLTDAGGKGVDGDPLAGLRAAIDRGECRATVNAIRAFLSCSQSRAMQIRRELVDAA